MFKDRAYAGRLLATAVAEAVTNTPESRPIRTRVVGLARGGVLVAKEIATTMHAPLCVMATKHINSPKHPDEVVAAVCSTGALVYADGYDESIEGLPSYVRNQQMQLSRLTKTLEEHWYQQANVEPLSLGGKRVVLVSDYVTNGIQERAALKAIKQERPHQIIFATPVISEQARYRLHAECQLVVALQIPSKFRGPMQFYQKFNHVEDDDIVEALKAANRTGSAAARE